MPLSVTRKFLVTHLPDVSHHEKIIYERYYLYSDKKVILRVQKINDVYEIERKENKNSLIREGQTIIITREEFDVLKKLATHTILRDSYTISDNPKVVIRIYHGAFEGLQRAEVNFTTEEEAKGFKPYDWMGKEITGTPLSQDGYLLGLKPTEFTALLQ